MRWKKNFPTLSSSSSTPLPPPFPSLVCLCPRQIISHYWERENIGPAFGEWDQTDGWMERRCEVMRASREERRAMDEENDKDVSSRSFPPAWAGSFCKAGRGGREGGRRAPPSHSRLHTHTHECTHTYAHTLPGSGSSHFKHSFSHNHFHIIHFHTIPSPNHYQAH